MINIHNSLLQGSRIASTIWRHPANRRRKFQAVAQFLIWQIAKRIFPRPFIIGFHGKKLYCYSDSHSASAVLYFNGLPDYWEMLFILAYLKPGDHFLDIGANVGVYSILALSCIGEEGCIDAFEPMDATARRLEAQAQLNNARNFHIHRCVVSDRNGAVEFGFSGDDATMHLKRGEEPVPLKIHASSIRLDDFETSRRYAMGKMDIEGAEPLALKGAERRLRQADPPVWLLELAGYSQYYGMTTDEVIAFLDTAGYECAIYDPERRNLEYTQQPWTYGVQNVLVISKAHKTEVMRRIRHSTLQ